MTRRIRCCWVGLGALTGIMRPAADAAPWLETVAVVDPRLDARETARGWWKLPPSAAFADIGQALAASDAEAVIINTPSTLHTAQCAAAIDAGRHVLVAKPLTDTYQDAVALVERARRRGVTLSVGQQIRYNRHYAGLARYLAGGGIGAVEAVFFMNSKPRPQPANLAGMPQPALFENACHHFDTFLALFPGAKPESIACDGFRTSWSKYDGPCMVNALIRFAHGPRILYHGGFSSQSAMYEMRLEGTAGALRIRGTHMSQGEPMAYEVAAPLGGFAPATVDAGDAPADPFAPFLDAWRAYLADGVEPPFSGRGNLRVMAMIAAATESIARGGAPVAIADAAAMATA